MFSGSKQGRSEPRQRKGSSMSSEKWKPPPAGWVKLNTDADFCTNYGMAGTAVVVRDPDGKVLLTTRHSASSGDPQCFRKRHANSASSSDPQHFRKHHAVSRTFPSCREHLTFTMF
jgi:hypothetical protein